MGKNVMEKMVDEFIGKVKEKLPEWLKSNKSEFNNILEELEEHVWDKAEELSGISSPTEDSVRMAIAHMGTPQSIAKEYKRRGTPKVYITEELWPIYTKVLGILIAVVIAVNLIGLIVGLIFSGFVDFSYDMSGTLLGIAGVFTLVTIIFVALSMEGYLPEDFKSEAERKQEMKDLKKAKEKGWPISAKTGKPLKPFMSAAGSIVGGIIQMAIGLVFITLPFGGFIELMNPQFVLLLRIWGLFMVIEGTIDLVRGVIGTSEITTQQVLMIVKVSVTIAQIPFLFILLNDPTIISIPIWNPDTGFIIWQIGEDLAGLLELLFGFVIFLVIVGSIADIVKAVRLERYKNIQ